MKKLLATLLAGLICFCVYAQTRIVQNNVSIPGDDQKSALAYLSSKAFHSLETRKSHYFSRTEITGVTPTNYNGEKREGFIMTMSSEPSDPITYSGSLTFCEGGNVVLTAPANPEGATYQWTKNGDDVPGQTGTTYTATSSGRYSVVIKKDDATLTAPDVVVTVNPKPVADFTFSSSGQCSSVPVQFTNSSTGTGLTYSWNFGDPSSGGSNTSTAQNPTHKFTSTIGNGSQSFTVTLTTTNSSGCTNTKSFTINLKQLPSAALQGPSPTTYNGLAYFRQCSSAPSASLNFVNFSTTSGSNATYKIMWGDNSADYESTTFSSALSHTYSVGTYTLQSIVTGGNGCSNTATYNVFVGSNPAVGLGNPGNTTICTGSTLTFPISNTSSNPPGTVYTVTFNDNTDPIKFDHPAPNDVSHTFKISSCGTTSQSYSNSFSATIQASNPCMTSSATVVPIYVSEKPNANFTTSKDVICTNNSVTVTNTSSSNNYVDNGSCTSGKSVWSITPTTGWVINSGSLGNDNSLPDPTYWMEGTASVNVIFTQVGTYTIKLKTGNPNCGLDEITKTVCVNPAPVASFTLDNNKVCANGTVKATNTSNVPSCGSNTYEWSVSYTNPEVCTPNTSGYTYINNTSASSANPEFRFTNPGVYTISLVTKNSADGCASAAYSQQVTVKSRPNVSISATSTICQNQTIIPTASMNNCYATNSATYSWSFNGGTPSTAAVANPGSITYNTAGTFTMSLSAQNECGTGNATKIITVNPAPDVIVPGNLTLCKGSATGNLDFRSSLAGTIYTWSNSNTSIGLGASGTGDIRNFNVENNGSSPVTATITVTPSNSNCSGPSQSFTITVNPRPTAPATSAISYCQWATAGPLTANTVSGYTLKWYTSTSDVTGATTAPTPSTSSPGSATYYVSAINPSTGCESDRTPLSVTVKAKPVISYGLYANTTSCGSSNGSITLYGLSAGITYDVTYTKGGVTQTIQGLANSSGQITISNLSAGTYSNIYVTLNGCSSAEVGTYTISDPAPPVTPVIISVTPICSGNALNLNASSTTPGVSFIWTGPNSFSGTGASQMISSATTSASGDYTVIASKDNCNSAAATTTVTVKLTPSTPTVNNNGPICSDETLTLSASTTTIGTISYSWTGPNSFTNSAQNPVISNVTTVASGTYTVVATLDNCPSPSASTNVVIKQRPFISGSSTNPNTCNSSTGKIVLTGLRNATLYTVNYQKNGISQGPTNIQSGANGSLTIDNLPAATYSNVTVTLDGCVSNAVGSFSLTDPNPPSTPAISTNSPLCSGSTLTLNASSTTTGIITYNWSGPNGFSYTGASTSISNVSTTAAGSYSVVAILNGCTSASASVPVTINLTPATPSAGNNNPMCSGNTLNLTASTTTAGNISYFWTGPNSYSNSAQNPSINSAATTHSGTYSVTATLGSCISAAGATTVTINPTPVINSSVATDPNACNTNTGNVKLGGLTPNTQYTVSYKKNSITQSPVQITADGSGYLTIPNLSAGNYMNVSVRSNGCVSNEVGPFELKDPNPPTTPSISGETTLCAESNLSLTASSATAGVSYAWSGPRLISGNAPSLTVNNVDATYSGTYTVVVTKSGCIASASVTVTVNPKPAKPTVTAAPVTYCLNQTAVPLTATAVTNNTLTWYDNAGLNNGQGTAFTPVTTTDGNQSYFVTQANGDGCKSDATEILVKVYPLLANNQIEGNQTLCFGSTAASLGQKTNTTMSGGAGSGTYSYQWQSRPADNSTDWQNITSNATGASYLPGVLANSTQFRRIVNSDKCSNQSEPVIITIQSALANYNISADQTICAGTSPDKLLGGETTGGSGTNIYQWESSTDGSHWSVVGNERDYQPGTLSTTTYYQRKVSSGQCSIYSNMVTITVNPKPVLNALDDLIGCNNATVNGINFTSSLPWGVSYTWTNDKTDIGLGAGGNGSIGSFTIVNPLSPKGPLTSTISVIPTYTYNGVGCAGDSKSFKITVLPLITIQPITDKVECTGKTIDAYTPVHDAGTYTGSSVTYQWIVEGSGISLGNGSGTQIPSYTTINNSTSDLVAKVTVTPLYKYQEYTCEGTPVSYKVTVKSATPSAAAGPDKILCAVSEYNMQATAIAGTTGTWTQVGDNDVAIDDASSATTKISVLQPDKIYRFKWTVKGFESCPATEDIVVITNRPVPTTAHAGSYGPICDLVNTRTITLDANAAAHRDYEKGEWSVVSPAGAIATFSDQSNPKSTVTFNKPGDYNLVWTISNDAGCTPSASEVLISVYEQPVAGSLTATRDVCAGTDVGVTLNGAVGTIYKWQYKTTNDNDWMDYAGNGTTVTLPNVQSSFDVKVFVRSKGYGKGCDLEVVTESIHINVAPPTVPGTTAGEKTVCKGVEGGTVILSGNTGAVVRWEYSEDDGVNWSSIPNSASNSYTYVSLLTTTSFRAVVKSGACGELVSTSTKILVLNPVTQANAGQDQRLCNATSINLGGNTPGVYENGTWTVVTGSGATIESPRNAQTKVSGLQPGTYVFKWTLANGYCTPTSDEVTIIIDAPLTNNISLHVNTICAGQQAVLIGATPTGGNSRYDYQWQISADKVTWSSINGATGVSLTFIPTGSVWVRRLVTSLPCTSESNPVYITVQAAIDNNTISADQQICINTAAIVLRGSLPTGGDGQFIYTWEKRVGNGAWEVIGGEIGQYYEPGVLTVTTQYRRKVETNLCSGAQAKESNIVTITVNPDARAEFVPTKIQACTPFALTPSIVGLRPDASRNGDYEWFVNDVSIGRGQTFPGYTIADEGDTVMLKLVAISKFGCLNSEQSQEFTTFIAPKPAFDLTPSEGCGPLIVGIQNTTSYASLFTYQWDFGNGQTSNDLQPGNVTFQPNPTFGDTVYTIKLTATSSCEVVSTTSEVKVKSKPKALFTPSKTVGCSPMTVTFNNTSKGIGNSYEWDFGDGNTLSTDDAEMVSHTFHTGVQDTFYVRLKAINECGEDVREYAIVVAPNAIKLDFALNGDEHYGCAPHTVRFINNTKGATGFQWDFGDGNTTRTTKGIDTVLHAYLQPGVYTVQLRAFNGCSDTTSTEVIQVFAKPKAAFTASGTTVCLGDTVRFENNSYDATTYTWKFGDGAVSNLKQPEHHYTKTGVYPVVLITERVNEPGNVCIDSMQHMVEVTATQKGWFDVSGLTSTCAPFTVTFTNRNTPAVTTEWNFGDGTTATGDVVTHTFKRSGHYPVTLTTLVPGGCTYATIRDIDITGPDGTLAYKAGYICNDQSVRFEATINHTDSLVWNFGDGTTLRTKESIVYHRYEKGGSYLPSVTLLGAAQCSFFIGGQDSIKVDKIKAGYTAIDDKLCGSTTVQFRDTSFAYFGLSEVRWKLGDGLATKGSSFKHTYTTTGDYPVQQIVSSFSGCSDTLNRIMKVKVYDVPEASIVGLDSSCTGTPVAFKSVVQSEDSVSITRWTTSNNLSGSEPVFKASFTNTGNYDLRLIAGTVYGCYDTVTHRIKINPTPVVTASQDVDLCRGSRTQLSVSGALKYSWSPLGGLSCTTCANPVANPLVTTPYVVEGKNVWNCPAYDTVEVTVIQPFKMQVTANDSICIGTSKQLVAKGASSYHWTPGTGLSDSTISNPLATPTATTHYRIVGYDNYNCFTDTAFVLVGVGGYSKVSLGADNVLSTGTLYNFGAVIENGPIKTWNWSPATELSCTTCPSPVAHIKRDITYTVQVTNHFKCTSSDTLNIKVFCEQSQVFIPNAFTPDGDGVNDILMVRAKGVAMVKTFRIFNRWGEVVFERSNFTPNDQRYAWDGKIRGIVGGPDVFVYTAEVLCENGVPFTYKGNVSIIK